MQGQPVTEDDRTGSGVHPAPAQDVLHETAVPARKLLAERVRIDEDRTLRLQTNKLCRFPEASNPTEDLNQHDSITATTEVVVDVLICMPWP